MSAHLTFWFDPASTYAYLSAMRIEALAEQAGVRVDWEPFLLGPIFKAQGWETSPFNVYPAKGRYMVRDIERIARQRGLAPFAVPHPFPAHSLTAARVALALRDTGRMPDFVKVAFLAAFADQRDIGAEAVLSDILGGLGLDAGAVLAEARSDPIKSALRANTERAAALGIFGAPSFTTADEELFWGDDRLEAAIEWASRLGA